MNIQAAMQAAIRGLEASELDGFEVVAISESTLSIEVKQQMVDFFQRGLKSGIAIRAVAGGGVGFSATSDTSPRAVARAVDEAAEALRYASCAEVAAVPPPALRPPSFSEPLGRPFGEVSDDAKVRIAMLLESAAIAAERRVQRVHRPRYEEREIWLAVSNSRGLSVEGSRRLAICELKAVAEDGGDAQGAYEFAFSPRIEDLNAEAVALAAARRAAAKLGAAPTEGGERAVLLAPRAAAAMVKLAAPSFFADNVQKGKSLLAGKRGEMLYSPKVSIVDDGLLPGGFGSFAFDGEGVPRQRTVMARNGVIEGWLYDWARAARDGVASTGNCSRDGLTSLPAIGVGNCFIKGGDELPEELMGRAEGSLMVTELLGVHTANAVTGDFSLGAEGFLIEGGREGRPVRGVTIAGNVHGMLGRVVGVASDLKFFGECGAPSLLVEGLVLGGN